MLLQPKTSIKFRSQEEREAIQIVAEKQGIDKVATLNSLNRGRAYICPNGYRYHDGLLIETWDDPDSRCSADDDDPFKWTYVEASVLLHNIIISERKKKNGAST